MENQPISAKIRIVFVTLMSLKRHYDVIWTATGYVFDTNRKRKHIPILRYENRNNGDFIAKIKGGGSNHPFGRRDTKKTCFRRG